MKKILFVIASALLVTNCSEPKKLTPQEAWQGFCKSASSTAFNIMTDRQQGIKKEDALTHIKKIQDPQAQSYLADLIEEAYQVPLYTQMHQKEEAMDKFSQNRESSCVAKFK